MEGYTLIDAKGLEFYVIDKVQLISKVLEEGLGSVEGQNHKYLLQKYKPETGYVIINTSTSRVEVISITDITKYTIKQLNN